MKVRILVGAVLSAFLIAILYFGGYPYLIAISLFSFAAVYETAHVTANRGYRPLSLPAYTFALCFPFVFHFFGIETMVIFYLFCIVISMMGIVLRRASEPENAIVTLLFFVYPISLLMCLLLVFFRFERTAAILAFVTPVMTDTFAYFAGTFFGKHKLCEAISPKKTVEGAIGGLIGGVLTGALLIPIQSLWNGTIAAPILLFLGLACGVCAQFGDLFASILKRWAGVKDFSSVFPGHGGIMDRIDSILLCAPVVLSAFTILQLLGIY